MNKCSLGASKYFQKFRKLKGVKFTRKDFDDIERVYYGFPKEMNLTDRKHFLYYLTKEEMVNKSFLDLVNSKMV